jgi:DNA-binding CsgD family transcriptional regulator
MKCPSSRPPPDGGFPGDSDLHRMSDDGGPVGPDPARWVDPVWGDAPLRPTPPRSGDARPGQLAACRRALDVAFDEAAGWVSGEHPAPPAEPLDEREVEVLRLTACGHSPQRVADQLNRAVRGVRADRDRAMAKLGLRTRRGVVRYAARRGWLTIAPLAVQGAMRGGSELPSPPPE